MPNDRREPPSGGTPAYDSRPALPAASPEETDLGWGERPDPDDDERLLRDRPPHWDSC